MIVRILGLGFLVVSYSFGAGALVARDCDDLTSQVGRFENQVSLLESWSEKLNEAKTPAQKTALALGISDLVSAARSGSATALHTLRQTQSLLEGAHLKLQTEWVESTESQLAEGAEAIAPSPLHTALESSEILDLFLQFQEEALLAVAEAEKKHMSLEIQKRIDDEVIKNNTILSSEEAMIVFEVFPRIEVTGMPTLTAWGQKRPLDPTSSQFYRVSEERAVSSRLSLDPVDYALNNRARRLAARVLAFHRIRSENEDSVYQDQDRSLLRAFHRRHSVSREVWLKRKLQTSQQVDAISPSRYSLRQLNEAIANDDFESLQQLVTDPSTPLWVKSLVAQDAPPRMARILEPQRKNWTVALKNFHFVKWKRAIEESTSLDQVHKLIQNPFLLAAMTPEQVRELFVDWVLERKLSILNSDALEELMIDRLVLDPTLPLGLRRLALEEGFEAMRIHSGPLSPETRVAMLAESDLQESLQYLKDLPQDLRASLLSETAQATWKQHLHHLAHSRGSRQVSLLQKTYDRVKRLASFENDPHFRILWAESILSLEASMRNSVEVAIEASINNQDLVRSAILRPSLKTPELANLFIARLTQDLDLIESRAARISLMRWFKQTESERKHLWSPELMERASQIENKLRLRIDLADLVIHIQGWKNLVDQTGYSDLMALDKGAEALGITSQNPVDTLSRILEQLDESPLLYPDLRNSLVSLLDTPESESAELVAGIKTLMRGLQILSRSAHSREIRTTASDILHDLGW
jgi:hypothetical protein